MRALGLDAWNSAAKHELPKHSPGARRRFNATDKSYIGAPAAHDDGLCAVNPALLLLSSPISPKGKSIPHLPALALGRML